jgi:anti-sigma factor RsiW
MTMNPDDEITLADLADGLLSEPEWEAWLEANPEAAAELEIARRVRSLVAELRSLPVALPAGFEERLLEQVRVDATLLDLLDLSLARVGGAILELLEALFGLLPAPRPA